MDKETQSSNTQSKFDPITLEILWRRLLSIVDEADASVARTAFSSLLRDAHDYTCMFTDSRDQFLAPAVRKHAGVIMGITQEAGKGRAGHRGIRLIDNGQQPAPQYL